MKCPKCDKGRPVKRNGMCDACCAKDWRKRNPDKVKSYQKFRYNRDKKKILKYSKEWQKNNPEKVNDYQRKRKRGQKEYEAVARETRRLYGHLKKKCEECPSTKSLQFHHYEPLAIDNFIILCRSCHMKLHSKLDKRITPFNDELCSPKISSGDNKDGN